MSKLKTYIQRLSHKKAVRKKQMSGRCYNFVDGCGWSHYTKGFRKHTVSSSVINEGSKKLFDFLGKVTSVVSE